MGNHTPLKAGGDSQCYRCRFWNWAIVAVDNDKAPGGIEWFWEHICTHPAQFTPGDWVRECSGFSTHERERVMGFLTGLIPGPYRWLAMALMAVALLGIGFMQGTAYEGNARDAAAYKQSAENDKAFNRALARGTDAARAAIAARVEADAMRRKLRERIDDAKDTELITEPACSEPQPHGETVARAFMFSSLFVRLYNDAWTGGYALPADTGGALTAPIEAGAVSAKDILRNTETNAGACAADRDRQNRLIDLLETQE